LPRAPDAATPAVAALELLTDAGHRPARADAGDEDVDPPVERLPQLRAGRAPVNVRVGWVGELVGKKEVLARGERTGGVDGLVHPAERLGHLDARPVEAQQTLALATHPLRE